MQLYANFLRVGIFLIALYSFFSIDPMLGGIIVLTGVFSFVFFLRSGLLLHASSRTDTWEFAMVGIIFVNALILSLGWYEGKPWVDIPMHIAGGLFAAWWGALVFEKERSHMPLLKQMLLLISIGVMVGVAWEGFEWLFDQTVGIWYNLPPAQPSITDVIMDLLNDTLGAITIALLFIKKNTRKLTAE